MSKGLLIPSCFLPFLVQPAWTVTGNKHMYAQGKISFQLIAFFSDETNVQLEKAVQKDANQQNSFPEM